MNGNSEYSSRLENGLMSKQGIVITIIWIAIAVLGRLLPHPPNITPFTALCLFAIYKTYPRQRIYPS